MLTVYIDILTPCLKETATGKIVETEAVKITKSSTLSKFSVKTKWHVSWKGLLEEGNEIYALVIKGTTKIQGLAALKPDYNNKAVYASWIAAAPQNNPVFVDKKEYDGVGGHLFAIIAERSKQLGFGGALYGDAANMELVDHYCNRFDAYYIPTAQYKRRIFIDEKVAERIMEVYTYEWTEKEL